LGTSQSVAFIAGSVAPAGPTPNGKHDQAQPRENAATPIKLLDITYARTKRVACIILRDARKGTSVMERNEAIAAAFAQLNHSNAEHWVPDSGVPRLSIMRTLSGLDDLSRAELDPFGIIRADFEPPTELQELGRLMIDNAKEANRDIHDDPIEHVGALPDGPAVIDGVAAPAVVAEPVNRSAADQALADLAAADAEVLRLREQCRQDKLDVSNCRASLALAISDWTRSFPRLTPLENQKAEIVRSNAERMAKSQAGYQAPEVPIPANSRIDAIAINSRGGSPGAKFNSFRRGAHSSAMFGQRVKLPSER
jgi:hypothetical protein